MRRPIVRAFYGIGMLLRLALLPEWVSTRWVTSRRFSRFPKQVSMARSIGCQGVISAQWTALPGPVIPQVVTA